MQGRTIAVLSALLAGTYFGKVIGAVADAAAAQGATTLAIQTQNLVWSGPALPQPGEISRVAWERADGFVVILSSVTPEHLRLLRAEGKSVVLVSHDAAGTGCPSVLPDNRSGVREAVEHLLWHGHSRIAFVGDNSQHDIQERYEAYCDTLVANGHDPDPRLFYPIKGNLEEGGRDAGRMMLEAGLPSTAVIAATDYNAAGIMSVLRGAGLSLPRDQAVVGFDDMPGSDLLSPALSTVGLDLADVAREAVAVIARQLNAKPWQARTYVPTSFLARESCGCAQGGVASKATTSTAAPVEAFASGVQDLLGSQCSGAGADGISELAAEIGRTIVEASQRALSPLELIELGQLAQRLRAWDSTPRAFGVLVLARRLARQYEGRAANRDKQAVTDRLDACLQQLSMGLARAGVVEQREANAAMSYSVWTEYDISMELLKSHEKDPRSLEWMAKTIAQMGVLALWSPGEDGAVLEVAGTYERARGASETAPERYRSEEFPPLELLERAAASPPGALVLVLPVRTLTADWGYLSLLAPPGATLTSQESFFQWSALLSQALDYEAVTASLRQRNQDLAFSYQRERELADTIRQSEERYALAARAANDGLWDWDLTTGDIYYSPRWKEMLGYGTEAIGSSPEEWFGRVHPDDRPSLMGALTERRRGEKGPFEVEHRVRAADGSYRRVLCRGLGVPEDGRLATRLVGSLTDVTEQRSLEEQLLHQALYDNLTGLPNRALFLDRLAQSIAYARRAPGYDYAVLWLDLDGFKVVNDSLGHLAGDRLLVRVAERISTHLREADTAARFGGDEFAILLHHVPDFAAVDGIVGRLLDDLKKPYELDGEQVVVTASIGIASSANGYDKPEDVLRDADIAMYQAKSAGRSGSATFDSSMYAGAISRLQTENALRQAIELEQLELHYQPIVRLCDGRLSAMEVLVRWRHPQRGLIAPADFLPVAEESGLIVPIGAWVQLETCRQVFDWKSAGLIDSDLRASINLSNREFWNPGLLDQIDRVLRSTGCPASWVSFEITEGVIMHNLERALHVLGELHARGIQIHIDDFGTGYSSLEALHRLPIDALKIDRSFVANLQDNKSTELVRTIVQLGRNLGVDVIAEGIETPAQQHALHLLDCPLGQGYWFSMPVPAGRLGELLSADGPLPLTDLVPATGPSPGEVGAELATGARRGPDGRRARHDVRAGVSPLRSSRPGRPPRG